MVIGYIGGGNKKSTGSSPIINYSTLNQITLQERNLRNDFNRSIYSSADAERSNFSIPNSLISFASGIGMGVLGGKILGTLEALNGFAANGVTYSDN